MTRRSVGCGFIVVATAVAAGVVCAGFASLHGILVALVLLLRLLRPRIALIKLKIPELMNLGGMGKGMGAGGAFDGSHVQRRK